MEQIGKALTFYVFYIASKVGKTGLTDVTVDVYDPTGSRIVLGAATYELGDGVYFYTLASGSVTIAGQYLAIFKTSDATVDQQHIPALWLVGKDWVQHLDADTSSRADKADYTQARAVKLDNLDVTVGSRGTGDATAASQTTILGGIAAILAAIPSASAVATAVWGAAARTLTSFGTLIADLWAYVTRTLTSGAPPTTGQIADAVWDEPSADHIATGSTGQKLSAAGGAADPLLNAVPGTYPSGTAGAALGKIGTVQVTTVNPVAQGGAISIIRGDDYSALDARALEFTDAGGTWPDLAGARIDWTAEALSVVGSVVQAIGPGKVRVQLTAAQTRSLRTGVLTYDIQATLTSGRKLTLIIGSLLVQDDVTL